MTMYSIQEYLERDMPPNNEKKILQTIEFLKKENLTEEVCNLAEHHHYIYMTADFYNITDSQLFSENYLGRLVEAISNKERIISILNILKEMARCIDSNEEKLIACMRLLKDEQKARGDEYRSYRSERLKSGFKVVK